MASNFLGEKQDQILSLLSYLSDRMNDFNMSHSIIKKEEKWENTFGENPYNLWRNEQLESHAHGEITGVIATIRALELPITFFSEQDEEGFYDSVSLKYEKLGDITVITRYSDYYREKQTKKDK